MAKASQVSSTSLPKSDIPIPVMSSESLGWQPLLVEEFQQPPGGTDLPEAWVGHSIALCLAPRPHRIHQMVGDRCYTGLYSKGDISITPADIPASYRAEGDDHYLHVLMPAQFLQSVAQEAAVNPDRLELVTEFRVRDPQLEQILLLLKAELYKGGGGIGRLYAESLANVLAAHLLREYSSDQPRVTQYEGGLGDRKLLQVSEYIHAHLDQDIKLVHLADVASVSQFHFSRLFKQSTGISPHQYLLQQRVERAKQLLKTSQLAIAEVALQCGFNSQSHLGKAFREATGMTPGNYRKY
ncbi:helix-turn-helix domain-containing protein [Leptolyngbya sp. FACHB-711]|uniref:helix-turn-helix domain-containing protein n=1 Tax=unclassified Leptolyngbya TaxID=2650499 RepID=UPI001685F8F8|nr:helix-turn-helix domain-containing protein [Leptolyngbya sp. FACHB-711]MBD1851707.1 helix-turn-helix domain-containing protein [Cyanobacteria bacterium FACHB-502]MBD2025344.1 helix-turn-helix domain-containing protein [Leptolyngbya sp. FACHB-711]